MSAGERESYHVSNRNKAESDKTSEFIYSFWDRQTYKFKEVEKRGGKDKKKTSREYKETGQEEFSIHLPSKVNTKRCEDRKQYLYLRRGKINKYQK